MPSLLLSPHLPGLGSGSWEQALSQETALEDMSDFSTDTGSQLAPAYDRYSQDAMPEVDEWPESGSHEPEMADSPQSSVESMMDSPQSESRRSVDIGAGAPHGEGHMSLSERRQEKRKMKRFRLTHSQTRFLMSEFARQAHPDAAHRERLAKEIPGLSPRQVQVWFQNRRAKLKRMSSDDRERMMKSRALPEEFPTIQTLHNYGSRMMGTPVGSPTEYSPTTSAGGMYRPDPLRRRHFGEDEVAVSPTTPGYGLSFAPNTPTSSDLISPISASGERPSYLGYMTAPLGPQQRNNPFSRTNEAYRPHHPSVPRLQLRGISSHAENAGSPLRSSTPYSAALEHEYEVSPSNYSIQGMSFGNEPPRSIPPDTPESAYAHSTPGTFTHPYPSPAPMSAHSRPGTFPPPLTLAGGEFKYPQPPLTPHSGTMSGFATAPLAPPQEYHIPQMSAPADSTSFSSSYLTRGSGSLGSATAPGAPGQDQHPEQRLGRLSLGGRDFGHRRQRSSSHPPNFPQHREP